MIQGKTEIVLTDVNTGKVEKIQSKNVFQGQHIAKYLRSLGMSANTNVGDRSSSYKYPLWKHTVGGLFLFADEITEGSQYMPAGNSMVGAGAVDMTHTGAPNEWGSYNANESSAGLNGITQVYDFTTDQANGTISCVCLTSWLGARIGYGHSGDSYLWTGSPWTFNGQQDTPNYDKVQSPVGWMYKDSNGTEWEMLPGSASSSYYQINDGQLVVRRRRYGVSKFSMLDSFEEEISFNLQSIGTNPLGITSSSYGYTDIYPYEDAKFVISPRVYNASPGQPSKIAAGAKLYYYILDMDRTPSLTVAEYTNPTGVTISNSANGRCAWSITPDKCIILSKDASPYTLYKADLTTGQVLRVFDNVRFGGSYRVPGQGSYGQNIVPGLELFMDKNTTNGAFIYDPINDTLKRINCDPDDGNYVYNAAFDVLERNFVNGTGNGNSFWLANNPLYLATINNLETPVQKTAAQTMKVTYTLTEV